MDDKELVEIKNQDGSLEKVELVTYLVSEDKLRNYMVYSKGEVQGEQKDHVIYISKVIKEEGNLKLLEIEDDAEWKDVQRLLKRIANV